MKHIPFHLELVPDLPNIVGNKDYKDFRKLLERIEEVLIFSGIEDLAVQSFIESHLRMAIMRRDSFQTKVKYLL